MKAISILFANHCIRGNSCEVLENATCIAKEEDEKRMGEPIDVEFVDAEGTMKKEKAVVKRLIDVVANCARISSTRLNSMEVLS